MTSGERLFFIGAVFLLSVVVISVSSCATLYYRSGHESIVKMVGVGANPVVAGCSIWGFSETRNIICLEAVRAEERR